MQEIYSAQFLLNLLFVHLHFINNWYTIHTSQFSLLRIEQDNLDEFIVTQIRRKKFSALQFLTKAGIRFGK